MIKDVSTEEKEVIYKAKQDKVAQGFKVFFIIEKDGKYSYRTPLNIVPCEGRLVAMYEKSTFWCRKISLKKEM